MTFSESLGQDLVDTFFNNDEFATSASYEAVSEAADSVLCSVIVDHNAMVQADGYEAGIVTVGTTVEALFSDVGQPKKGDKFVIGGTTYIVKDIDVCDKVTTKVVVVERGY